MRVFHAALYGLSLAAGSASAATVAAFDNFGPDYAFDTGTSGLVGPGPTGYIQFGLIFTSQASGAIESVTVPLSADPPTSQVTMALYEWTGTAFGSLIDSEPAEVPTGTASTFIIDGWNGGLTSGDSYVLLASASSQSLWWASRDASSGEMMFLRDGIPGTQPGWTAAARVDVGEAPSPIPLPASLPLLAAGLAVLGITRRLRSRRA
jgi:hypothetical protein